MNDGLNQLIAIGTGVAAAVVTLVVVVWLWVRHARGSAAMRARRAAAGLAGPIVVGAPFELAGVARPGPSRLHLEMQIDVIGGADVEISFRAAGVRIVYEVLADGVRIAGAETKVPPDSTKLGPDVRATDSTIPSPRTHIRCTIGVGDLLALSPGARITLRGTVTPLPDNVVGSLTAWIG